MPDPIYKVAGNKIVPLNRFNLEEGKLSTNFNTTTVKEEPAFSVIAHPVLTSIALQPAIIAILNKEYFPLIDNNSNINPSSTFNDFNDANIKLQFPEIEVTPLNNNQIFYYENVLNEKGENSGYLGKVTINYIVKYKPTTATLQNIPIQLKEAILNLKIKDDIVKISGIVDEINKQITFNLKDEAVKLAFTNLVTNIDELKSNIDLFFNFKGYTKARHQFLLAKFDHINMLSLRNRTISSETINKRAFINEPMIVNERARLKDEVSNTKIDNKEINSEYVKSTFILKVNKAINYPLQNDPLKSLYKTIGGGFIHNPFNFNEDFSLYEQIFVPGISLDKLSIYKSKVTPNEFLLISKRYNITRSNDTKSPCINTIFHGTENDSGLTNDISKISFQFAIGPDLSDFDLNKLKIDLFTNNFLDGDTTNYFDKINFVYPSDLQNSKYEINGNHYLQDANISIDGKYFLIDFSTINLNDASILINSINNSLSQFANINFIHKEIKDTSIIELNIQKTIGEVIATTLDNSLKKMTLKNESLSLCKVKSLLTIDSENKPFISSSLFTNYSLNSEEQKEIQFNSINSSLANKTINKVHIDMESIEDLAKEFSNTVATSSSFNKYIQIQIQSQKGTTSRVQVELSVMATGAKFNLERLKADFKTPLLINFLLNGSPETRIQYRANYFDKDNNMFTTYESIFDYSTSTILNIPKK